MDEFTAVVTTGIYCRPGCGGRPLARNTRPYAYAAAAEAAGFRPCLRCRPDREPEPGWIDAPELVCRAMRAIADGALDDATEDDLAARPRRQRAATCAACSTSTSARPRPKSRAFAARALRPPAARRHRPADRRRSANAAGFNSVRQMNRVMKDVFHFTPAGAARSPREARSLVADGGLELRVPYRPPLAWDALLEFLAPRAIPGVEAVDLDAGVYRRIDRTAGRAGRDRGVERTRPRRAPPARAPPRRSTGSCTSSPACVASSISTPIPT